MSNRDRKHGYRSGAALMIGVGDYPDGQELAKLPFAARDAETMAALFADSTVCNLAPDKVQLLVDAQATREKIIGMLSNWLQERARGTELAVIFLAGHGVLRRHGATEEGYFLSYDATADNVAANGISMRDIARWIEGIESDAIVVFLDCCHAGKAVFLRDGSESQIESVSQSVLRKLGFGPVAFSDLTGRRRFVIASCDEGQSSIESRELGHGLFTYHVIQGISGAADSNGDGRVDVTELFSYVSDAVARDAQAFGHEQRPWTHATWTDKVYLSHVSDDEREAAPQPSRPVDEKWLRDVEGKLVGGTHEFLLSALEVLRQNAVTEGVTVIFHCLAHQSETVRLAAKETLKTFRWAHVSEEIRRIAETAEEDRISLILEGLAAIEAQKDVVALLDTLVTLLKGNLWQRAVFLLERKRLGLTFEDIAELFRERESPYELCNVLGAGMFTAAYLATRRTSQLKFVVRVLRPEFASNPRVRQAFLDTSQHSFEFHHQSLVLTRDFGGYPDKALYYIVRDHVDGPTLRDVLGKGKTFEPAQCVRILQQIVAGLRPFHDGATPLLHGGIKPSNVFLARDGRIVLGDPSMPVPPPNTDLKRLAYDFRYVAPEAFRTYLSGLDDQQGHVDHRADYYSLGCLAYEVFCGVAPFIAENQYELFAKHDRDDFAPPYLDDNRLESRVSEFFHKLLAKHPDSRFSSIGEVDQALDNLLHDFDSGSGSDEGGVGPTKPEPGGGVAVIEDHENVSPEPLSLEDESRVIDEASLARYEPDRSLLSINVTTILPDRFDNPVHNSIISQRYVVLECIGQGGMGSVFRARDTALERIVAVKTIRWSQFGTSDLNRFNREASAIARLNHPGIVQVYDVGESGGHPYIVMEYLAGPSLSDVFRDGPITNAEVARLIGDIARALSFAHDHGIIHRDIKPSNILLNENGVPKICDFGLARNMNSKVDVTITGQIIGTPAFMSPEQARGNTHGVGPATDIYSLGCVMYQALTGSMPFHASSTYEVIHRIMYDEPVSPRQLNPGISKDLEVVCLKCLEKDPERRYRTARDLAEDLTRYAAGEAVTAHPISTLESIMRWCRRKPTRAALVVISAIATAAIATVVALLSSR